MASRDDIADKLDALLRLERLRQEVDGVRASREERERLSRAEAELRLARLKKDWQSRSGGGQ